MMNLVFLFFALTTSAHAALLIESNLPRAEVFSIDKAGARRALGRTPLTLEKNPRASIVVEAKGYAPTQLLIPPDVDNAEIKVELKPLTEWSTDYMNKVASEAADQAMDRIVKAQSFLDERKLALARPIIDSLLQSNPTSVAVRVLHANWLVLSGNRREALVIYKETVNDISPGSNELKDMIDRMVKALEGRRGASL